MSRNFEDFRNLGKQMVDYICDYMRDIEKYEVAPASITPGYLAPLLPKEAPEYPESYREIMEDFEKKVMPGMLHWNHPNFFGYFASGNAYPSVLGEMLSSAIATIGFSWASCPALTELEYIVLDWYAKALDLPDFFLSKSSNPNSKGGGALQASASDAIFACMCSARARAVKNIKGDSKYEFIHDSVFLPQLVCYCSSQAHSSSEKAAKVNLVKLRLIEPDDHDSMRGEALQRQIEKDVEIGLIPFFVVASLGTTSQCGFDNLVEIGALKKKYPQLWIHVDGAYAGNAFVVPEMRKYKAGIEFVDSMEVNPNKLMMTNFDCTCMWVKDVAEFTEAFTIEPVYLQHSFNKDIVDLRHFGTPLSRRFRSLKLYFLFRMYGLRGLQAFMRRIIAMGKHFEQLVRADNRFEIRNDVIVGLACIRLLKPDKVNQQLLAALNGSGKIHLTPSIVKGKFVIRFVAGQEGVNERQIENAWRIIQKYADEVLRDPISERRGIINESETVRHALSRNIPEPDKRPNRQRLIDEASLVIVDDSNEQS